MTDDLPPLPEPDWTEMRPTNPPRHGQHWYGEAKMRAYARAAVLAERERCAEIVLQELGDTGQAKAIAAAIRKGTP